ncbi:MAG: DUF4034 domain-containing protein [Deltaproteobacteria bacterium]|nr:DUF4034 domain-containing protein [Deltaproteobacteria bacterium]
MRPARAIFHVLILSSAGCFDHKALIGETETEVASRSKAKQTAPKVTGGHSIRSVPELPLPTERPMIGGPGLNQFGEPVATADAAGLLALLRARKFEQLETYLASYQADFEADLRKERWSIDSARAFFIPDLSLEPILDEWVAHSPKSFASWLGRGVYLSARAWDARGEKYASETSAEQFAKMRELLARGRKDLDRALELRPNLQGAFFELINGGRSGGDEAGQAATLGRALAACPDCFAVRGVYLRGRTPEWGGSYEEMDRFAQKAQDGAQRNPKLAKLLDQAAISRCRRMKLDDKNGAEVEAQCTNAMAHAESATALEKRARAREKLGKQEARLADLTRAIELEPNEPGFYADRFRALSDASRFEEAADEVLREARLSPGREELAERLKWIRATLNYRGSELTKEKKYDEAVRSFDSALRLVPDDQELQGRRVLALVGKHGIEGLKERARTAKSNITFYDELVLALEFEKRFPEVEAAWNEFVAANPGRADAYFGRATYFHHSKQDAKATPDLVKACGLGHQEACSHVPKDAAQQK